jgi:hypothetical protein
MNYPGLHEIDVREILRREFECKIVGTVGIGVERGTGKAYLKLYGAAVGEDGEPLPLPAPLVGTPCEGGGTYAPHHFAPRPRNTPPSDEELAAWAQQVFDRASAGIPLLASAVAVEYLHGVAHLLEATGHEDDYDAEEVIADHLRQLEYYLREMLDAKRPGTRSKWTAITLSRAVREALSEIDQPSRHTLAGVAAKLKRAHGDKAPKTAEALRKLMDRLGVDWKTLKAEADT